MSEQMMICKYAHTCDKSDRCIAHKHQECCLGFYCHDTRRDANCIPAEEPEPTVAELMREIKAYDVHPRFGRVRIDFYGDEFRACVNPPGTAAARGDSPATALVALLAKVKEKYPILVCPTCGKPR